MKRKQERRARLFPKQEKRMRFFSHAGCSAFPCLTSISATGNLKIQQKWKTKPARMQSKKARALFLLFCFDSSAIRPTWEGFVIIRWVRRCACPHKMGGALVNVSWGTCQQWIDQLIDRLINLLVKWLISWSIDLSIEQLIDRLRNWSIDRWTDQSINQSIDRLINWSNNRTNWSINWSVDQSVDQLINQWTNWYIVQLINCSIDQ